MNTKSETKFFFGEECPETLLLWGMECLCFFAQAV